MTLPESGPRVNLELPLSKAEPAAVWLRSEDVKLIPAPEASVAATLLPAMRAGNNIALEKPLDREFTSNLPAIQDIYGAWYSDTERIAIEAPVQSLQASSSSSRTATFFSGGVDSFYTLVKNIEEIDALVYVHGFDVALDDTTLRQQVSNMLREVGEHFGKDVIELETNLRDFSNKRAGWGVYHGAALATVAHTLSQSFDSFFIPSTHTYADLFPWGSHPLLDPLWSSSSLQFTHDGCEATRVQKCEKIADHPVALKRLRVCWRNPNSVYNCGRCEKCMRTMVNLAAVGALDNCSVFDAPLDLSRLSGLYIQDKNTRSFVEENLSVLRRDGRHPEIVEALNSALSPPPLWKRVYLTLRSHTLRSFGGLVLRKLGLR